MTIKHGNRSGDGGGIHNSGTLTLTSSTLGDNSVSNSGAGIYNSSGKLTITNSTVSGNNAKSGGGIFNSRGTLTITDSTISDNTASSHGGGIFNNRSGAIAELTNVTISGNNANIGGGIHNQNFATLTLNNSTVSGNTAIGFGVGGGILNQSTLTLTNSTISGNTSNGDGAGINNQQSGTAALIDSTVSDNRASQSGGGGIVSYGTLTLTNSTVNGNAASRDGGGIWSITNGTVTLINSTVSDNRASNSGGGGIVNHGGTVTLTNSTVSGNTARNGGGIDNLLGTADLVNTIIASNIGDDCSGVVISFGHNLDSDDTCGLSIGSGDLPNTDPLLGSLADNGGPTRTHALLPESPAIDAGDDASCPATDQRGVARPQGAHCDIGAYEFGAEPSEEHVVTGTVSLEGMPNPISGARITFSAGDRTIARVFSDPEYGSFEVQLTSGIYDVEVEKDGFLPATKRGVVVNQDIALAEVLLLWGDTGDGKIDVSDLVIPAKNLGRTETPWQ